MGASGWTYYTPYDPDPREILATLQQTVLAERDYYWADEDLRRPGTLAELYELAAGNDAIAETGTHSILDIHQVGAAGAADEFGTILPLSPAEVRAAFGTSTPRREQFDAVYENGMNSIADFPRWSGRFTTLYEEDKPAQVVVWGYSGD